MVSTPGPFKRSYVCRFLPKHLHRRSRTEISRQCAVQMLRCLEARCPLGLAGLHTHRSGSSHTTCTTGTRGDPSVSAEHGSLSEHGGGHRCSYQVARKRASMRGTNDNCRVCRTCVEDPGRAPRNEPSNDVPRRGQGRFDRALRGICVRTSGGRRSVDLRSSCRRGNQGMFSGFLFASCRFATARVQIWWEGIDGC